jgi:hypothetical protein
MITIRIRSQRVAQTARGAAAGEMGPLGPVRPSLTALRAAEPPFPASRGTLRARQKRRQGAAPKASPFANVQSPGGQSRRAR